MLCKLVVYFTLASFSVMQMNRMIVLCTPEIRFEYNGNGWFDQCSINTGVLH